MEIRNLVFDWMLKDKVVTHVEANFKTREVIAINYTDIVYEKFFYNCEPSIERIFWRFKDRCFEECRPDKNILLKQMGLNQYSPVDIVRFTHGHTNRDDLWIQFEGEDFTYDEINYARPNRKINSLQESRAYKDKLVLD